MDSIPLSSADLIKRLHKQFPRRHARPSDFQNEASKVRFFMDAGKRELIDWLMQTLYEHGSKPDQKILIKE